MATGIGVDQGKTAFLEEFLPGNRDAGLAEINEAWRASGHEGTLSESLVSKTRSRLKIPKARTATGGGGGGSKSKGKAKSSPKAAKAKAPKTKATPSKPGSKAGGGPGKTAFIREQLGRDATLDFRAINRAWSEAGHQGEISDNLVYKTRDWMGIGGRRGQSSGGKAIAARPETSPRKAEPAAASAPARPSERSNGRHAAAAPSAQPRRSLSVGGHAHELHRIEGEIDEMMYRLRGLGDFAEVLEALRTARRLLVRSHGD